MKQFTFKWLKRLWALIAVKLIIIAVLLTATRVVITSVNDYKIQFIDWIADEHNINVSIDKISAGIDFSGLILTLKEVRFDDADDLPFDLELEHLFLHLDFATSISQQRAVFNDISIKGANLTLKPFYLQPKNETTTADEQQSELTLDSLRNIFLSRLSSFSVKDSTFQFTDHLNNKKKIYIQDLSWLNQGDRHQGIGKAALLSTPGKNTLEFVIDIEGNSEDASDKLAGKIYAYADNVNAAEYLTPQINPLAQLKMAVVSFKLWGEFDIDGPKNAQLEWGDSQIAWSLLDKQQDWRINDGLLQLSFENEQWLFDSYDLNISHNYVPLTDIQLSGKGKKRDFAQFNLNAVNLNAVLPFGLLFSPMPEADIKTMSALEIGGELSELGATLDGPGEMTVNVKVDGFNNQPLDAIPGISHADITVTANQKMGTARIQLPAQQIYFDGQFSRAMPVKNGDINLSWINDDKGFELKSEKTLLTTDDLDSTTQFSLLFPNETAKDSSPFLSLYSYASLNDGEKAQYYYPILAMGDDVFNYLEPTLKKGSVTGAKIVWYGSFSDYPYQKNEGVFQAWVPVKNAQYDFYGQWEGLTALDLDLLFENDYLLMDSQKAMLGSINVGKLSGVIDRLHPKGVLTIKASVEERADRVSKYLIESPLGESVGNALKIIRIGQRLKGDLLLTIPFNRDNAKTNIKGDIKLAGNDIDIELATDLVMPLKKVKGNFTFSDGDLTANGFSAVLFKQPINFSFTTKEYVERYHINAALSGHWNTEQLSDHLTGLRPLQLGGEMDWQGEVDFNQIFAGGYAFDVNLMSQLQGVKTGLPAPYNKHELQTWPAKIDVKGNAISSKWNASINNKVTLLGEINYQQDAHIIPYLYVGLGEDQGLPIDYTQQVIRINEDKVNVTEWLTALKALDNRGALDAASENHQEKASLVNIDQIYIDITHAELFEQPFVNFDSEFKRLDNFWDMKIDADNLQSHIEYRKGTPDRFDIHIDKMSFPLLELGAAEKLFKNEESTSLPQRSDNLRQDYPEVLIECKQCTYKDMLLSPLKAHAFPSKSRYTIDYLRLGGEDEFTTISGVWDQRRTNIIVDSKGNKKSSIVKRFGYTSPMIYEKAELTGALNWVGAPWQFNLASLNGAFSSEVENGVITEVNDKGARLLSFLSLDGIRRSLNLEFGNVFSKGLGFDKMSMSGNISNGIVKSDDYYLNGSAGKITGGGLIDLPNLNVNYRFSYSPAVTSSLPVLAAFVINPLTGAAVLMLTKILEPVVDTIIRVDFSVKGEMNDPVVTIESSQKGRIKLQNSEVLEEMEDQSAEEEAAAKALQAIGVDDDFIEEIPLNENDQKQSAVSNETKTKVKVSTKTETENDKERDEE